VHLIWTLTVQRSLPWEADIFLAGQEIPCISWNLEIH
jgi:hypothetical protein